MLKKYLPSLLIIPVFGWGATVFHTANKSTQCKYSLINQNYSEDMSGVLTIYGDQYRCEQYDIDGDSLTLCKTRNKSSLIVTMDGAEGNFFVYSNFSGSLICSGLAN